MANAINEVHTIKAISSSKQRTVRINLSKEQLILRVKAIIMKYILLFLNCLILSLACVSIIDIYTIYYRHIQMRI